jgi:RNA 3'-phosphate cyclase
MMLTIDGSLGEGGGQILRTALALATVTGKPFRIEKIRAGRPKPGLLRQHLTAVKAAASISDANVTGAEPGSGVLTFTPRTVRAGEFAFAVGTAGSATLVLQTVLPALITAPAPSTIVLEGGTHNPAAPPFDFLVKSFLPPINRMGPTVSAELKRPGLLSCRWRPLQRQHRASAAAAAVAYGGARRDSKYQGARDRRKSAALDRGTRGKAARPASLAFRGFADG